MVPDDDGTIRSLRMESLYVQNVRIGRDRRDLGDDGGCACAYLTSRVQEDYQPRRSVSGNNQRRRTRPGTLRSNCLRLGTIGSWQPEKQTSKVCMHLRRRMWATILLLRATRLTSPIWPVWISGRPCFAAHNSAIWRALARCVIP